MTAAEGISTAFHQIAQAPLQQQQQQPQQQQQLEVLTARGHHLLRLLDARAMADPQFAGPKGSTLGGQGPWQRLQGLSWCPVLQEPPEPGGGLLPLPCARARQGAVVPSAAGAA